MVPSAFQTHGYDHGHSHAPGQVHAHSHAHGPASPHPAQLSRWSILRMTLVQRLGAAVAVSALLWGVVFLAIR